MSTSMSLKAQFVTIQSTATEIVTQRPGALKAFNLEVTKTPATELLEDTETVLLSQAPAFMGFFTKSPELTLLDNTIARKEPYLTVLPSGSSFMTLYPEVAFQIMKFNEEYQQMSLTEFRSNIDEKNTPADLIAAFDKLIELTSPETSWFNALVIVGQMPDKVTLGTDTRSIGQLVAFASRVRTTENSLRPNWDKVESRKAMFFAQFSSLLYSQETFDTLMKTSGYLLIEDTQRSKDPFWGWSSARGKSQTLDGQNYLGKLQTWIREYALENGITASSTLDTRKELAPASDELFTSCFTSLF